MIDTLKGASGNLSANLASAMSNRHVSVPLLIWYILEMWKPAFPLYETYIDGTAKAFLVYANISAANSAPKNPQNQADSKPDSGG